MSKDIDYMRRCFTLAEQGRFSVRPNPVVGCVIVKDGEVAGEGWHHMAGQAHAEINALQQAGSLARGATAYVSLEPCAHHGRTGPCAIALINSGIKRVVYGMEDPNPLVSGKGLALLRSAGVDVNGPLLEEEAAQLNPGYTKRMRFGLPWVRCKTAMSLDGRTAMASGESKWITGSEAREDVQRLRARSCAVITGTGTVLQDDPQLNVRLAGYTGVQPLRVVVDSTLQTPPSAAIMQAPGRVLLACARFDEAAAAALQAAAAENGQVQLDIVTLPATDGKVDLPRLLHHLAEKLMCNEIMLEAGPGLGGAMLKTAMVDELVTYIAPALLGNNASPLFTLHDLNALDDRIRLAFLDVAMVGKDCRMRSRVLRPDKHKAGAD